jgi:hypothetical protein
MNLQDVVERNSPTILAGLGVLGFITASVMSAKATPKALEVADELPYEATTLDKVRALAPIYIPTAGMIMISAACIVASNRIHKQRYYTLLALYSIGEKTLQRLQESIMEEVGPKKAENIRERSVAPRGDMPGNLILDEHRVLCFDVYSGRYFRSDSVESIRSAVNDINELLLSEDFVSVNELYFLLHLPPMEIGDDAGWRADDGSVKIVLDSFIKDDMPCVSISFVAKPKEY